MRLEGEGRVRNLEAMGVDGLCSACASGHCTVISKAIVMTPRTEVANLHGFLLAEGYLMVAVTAWPEGIRIGQIASAIWLFFGAI